MRILFLPILYLLYAYSNCDINYKADIGPGLKILHIGAGAVISGQSIIGSHLTLTGGNVIGAKPRCKQGEIALGNHCTLGANAVVLGPVTLGDHVQVGALALVDKDAPDHAILVGVPAKNISTKN